MEKKQLEKPTKEKKPISKKKVITGVILICFAFLGSFLIYFIMQVSLNTEYPLVVVVSGSMEPNINKGDLLFLRGMEPDDIKSGTAEDLAGDVIVYDARGLWVGAPDEPIVHRVIDKWQDGGKWYFQTKGDANYAPDRAPVSEDRILGVVCGRIPFIGWVKIFLTDTGLFIPLLIILAVPLILSIIWDIIKGDEEDSESQKFDKKKREKEVRVPEEYLEKAVEIKKSDEDKDGSTSQEDDFDF